MIKLWIATTNQGKLREFTSQLSGLPLEIHNLREISYYSPPKEDGDSFIANARIKAKAFQPIKPQDWTIGEDSGLEVEGLNNLPGIHSARYAGDHASDAENNAKLLKMVQIRSPQNRRARFVCAMVLISPDKKEYIFEGSLEGTISIRAQGNEGFGYDPVFIPTGYEKTMSELGLSIKNKISHRSQALKNLREFLLTQTQQVESTLSND